jgi:nucleotide-binding universal stress UspA family protein
MVREGMPRAAILDVAREVGADLIVMGTHGRTGLTHVVFGSVAEHVVRHSRIPVLTVRQQG